MLYKELKKLSKPYFLEYLKRETNKFPIYTNQNMQHKVKQPVNLINNLTKTNNSVSYKVPKFLVPIKFKHKRNSEKYSFNIARLEAEKNIKELTYMLIANNVYYMILDHNNLSTSESPELYILINYEKTPDDKDLIAKCKLQVLEDLLEEVNLSTNFVEIDKVSLVTEEYFVVPGSFFYKNDLQENQNIISDNLGKPIYLSLENIKEIKNNFSLYNL